LIAEEDLPAPGILKVAFSQNRLALDIRVPPRRINEIVQGKRRITADTALRLGRYFGMSSQFWLRLQMDYDLDVEEDRLGDRLQQDVREHAGSEQ
jgi:addiction module HigA family antidote